jgi:hypothetical protein
MGAPSHAQADRVADGSIDLAIRRMQTPDLAEHGLTARLIGADRLHAVAVGSDRSAVDAPDTVVLLDADTATASSDVPAGTVVAMSARNSTGVAPSDVRSDDTLTPPPGRGRARGPPCQAGSRPAGSSGDVLVQDRQGHIAQQR